MTLPIFGLEGKVAIVTGSGRGIGRAIARFYAKSGADVVVVARSIDAIEETAELVRDEGRKALAVPTDVTKVDQIKELLNQTLNTFGKLDILVNNAGGFTPGGGYVLDTNAEEWLAGVELNLNSIFYCCRYLGEEMVKRKAGNIINISSGMGLGPSPGVSHHASPRAGVFNFTQSLALEWAPYNIRVNCISPGLIETPLTTRMWIDFPETKAPLINNIPMGRIGKPEEIAAAAVFLASDAASYVTGQYLSVCGGLITPVNPQYQNEYLSRFRDK